MQGFRAYGFRGLGVLGFRGFWAVDLGLTCALSAQH